MFDDESLVESSIKGIKSLSMNCVEIFFAETAIYSILYQWVIHTLLAAVKFQPHAVATMP